MKFQPVLKAFLLLGLLALVGLIVEAHHAGKTLSNARLMMRVGLENTAERVRQTTENLRYVREWSDSIAKARVRLFADKIRTEPSFLKNQEALNAFARELEVDELHVANENGVLIAGVPKDYVGYSMADSEQSSAFLPAITNQEFLLVQEPMGKGLKTGSLLDGQMFQYAGCARLDAPGIVQIGCKVERIEEAMRLADVKEIEKSARVCPGGSVSIVSNRGLPPAQEGVDCVVDSKGGVWATIERDVGEYRVCIRAPESGSWLAKPGRFADLVVFGLIYLLIFIVILPGSRQTLRQDVSTIRAMFGGRFRRSGAFRKAMSNPATVACAGLFILAIAASWFFLSRTAIYDARERLKAAADDMGETVDNCVDNMLFYHGNAICAHYRDPQRMAEEDLKVLTARYSLDEINVVDGRGVVLKGSLANMGFDFHSTEITSRFLCLLAGAKTYSQPFRAPIENPTGTRRKYVGVAFPRPAKGFIQIGFDESRLKRGVDYWFDDAARGWHIGERGYYIISDLETGHVLSCGKTDDEGRLLFEGGLTLTAIGLDESTFPKTSNTFFNARIFGEMCLCLTEVRCYHRIISVIPYSEITGDSERIVIITACVLLIVFLVVVFFMTKLTDLVMSLREYIAKDRANREKDLSVAKTIQISSLPVELLHDERFGFEALMVTAREVGGDFYDVYRVPSGKVFFLIADVSGKGIPAAMFMMKAKTTVRACAYEFSDFADSIAAANDRLAENNQAFMFVTAWFGLYDPASGVLEYVNSGHNPPLLKRANGSVAWIRDKHGPVLAIMPTAKKPDVERLLLSPGDHIYLYTDGVTEAMNPDGELYGEARLESLLEKTQNPLIPAVMEDVESFVKDAEQSDDITMLTLDVIKTNT